MTHLSPDGSHDDWSLWLRTKLFEQRVIVGAAARGIDQDEVSTREARDRFAELIGTVGDPNWEAQDFGVAADLLERACPVGVHGDERYAEALGLSTSRQLGNRGRLTYTGWAHNGHQGRLV